MSPTNVVLNLLKNIFKWKKFQQRVNVFNVLIHSLPTEVFWFGSLIHIFWFLSPLEYFAITLLWVGSRTWARKMAGNQAYPLGRCGYFLEPHISLDIFFIFCSFTDMATNPNSGCPSVRVITQQCLSARLQVQPPTENDDAQWVEVGVL